MTTLAAFPLQEVIFAGERLRGERRNHGVGRLILSRPVLRNAFDAQMVEEFTRCLEGFRALSPESLRVLVLEGEGPIFCAGADLGHMRLLAQAGLDGNTTDARALATLFRSLAAFPAPVVCMVQGAALGGGLGLAACSDVALADAGAMFATTEVRLGIVPGVISPFVLRKVGLAHGAPLLLSGRRISAEEARVMGLVQRVVPSAEDLDACLTAVLLDLLKAGPQAARATKALILQAQPLPDADLTEFTVQAIVRARASEEGQAGLGAFLGKQPAPWLAGLPTSDGNS
jgi:methylglutaconyl-CoA hydratase